MAEIAIGETGGKRAAGRARRSSLRHAVSSADSIVRRRRAKSPMRRRGLRCSPEVSAKRGRGHWSPYGRRPRHHDQGACTKAWSSLTL